MKYILIYKLDELVKEKIINGYMKDGFILCHEENNILLIKKDDDLIKDEEIYIKILFSNIKRNSLLKNKKLVIDLTKAFEYAKEHDVKSFDNKFLWFIRNIITKEAIK